MNRRFHALYPKLELDTIQDRDGFIKQAMTKEAAKFIAPFLNFKKEVVPGPYQRDYVRFSTQFIFMPQEHWEHVDKMLHILHGELKVRGADLLAGMVETIRYEIVNK